MKYTHTDIAQAHERALQKLDIRRAIIGIFNSNTLVIGCEPIPFDNGYLERTGNTAYVFTDSTGTPYTFKARTVTQVRDSLMAWLQSDRSQPPQAGCLHCGNPMRDKRRKYCGVRCRMAYYETEKARIRESREAA